MNDPYGLTLGPDVGHHFDYWRDSDAANGKPLTSAGVCSGVADLSGQTGARRQAGRFVGEADRRRDGGCHRCLGCFACGYRLGQAHHNHGRSCTTRTRRFGICSTGTRGADDVIGCAGRDAECDVDRGARRLRSSRVHRPPRPRRRQHRRQRRHKLQPARGFRSSKTLSQAAIRN